MDVIRTVLGWNYRIRRLRKRWDRLRERSLKKKDPVRGAALSKLDTVSTSLTTLEEQRLSRIDKIRLSQEVAAGLELVREMLKERQEDEDVADVIDEETV